MVTLFIIQEIAKIILYLSLPAGLACLIYRERKQEKERLKLVREVANKLLEKADDEKPIMLNVSQEKLIDKTIEEIEKRQRIGRNFN